MNEFGENFERDRCKKCNRKINPCELEECIFCNEFFCLYCRTTTGDFQICCNDCVGSKSEEISKPTEGLRLEDLTCFGCVKPIEECGPLSECECEECGEGEESCDHKVCYSCRVKGYFSDRIYCSEDCRIRDEGGLEAGL
ncbi:MAG: hypothetical protein WCW87_00175 [Candidatus Paceibacterota bacterium]